MFRFADPLFLVFLVVLIPIVIHFSLRQSSIFYSNIDLLKPDFKSSFNPRWIIKVLRILSITLFILALARPQSGKKLVETSSEGVDIMLAIDTSGSMLALDFKRNNEPIDRLEVIKDVVKEFIKGRPADRIGFVVFGEDAFIQCPLTLDHGILVSFLDQMQIGMAGQATAIGQALAVSIKRMKDLKSKSKIIILLTDGENNAGMVPPLKALELAESFGIKIYTIGAGTKGKAPYLQNTIFGKRYVYQDVSIDEELLTKLAEGTGGKYYRAQNTEELKKIYEEIDQLEKTKIDVKQYTEYNELFVYFLALGLILLLLEFILDYVILKKIP